MKKKEAIKKILFITLSNIGDAILTLPALDLLQENFPAAKITVMAGPRPRELFEDNPRIKRFVVYNKHAKFRQKLKLFFQLRAEGFDIVADLRNSFFGVILPAKYRVSTFLAVPSYIRHMKDRHLYKIRRLCRASSAGRSEEAAPKAFHIKAADKDYIEEAFRKNNIRQDDKIIVIACGARSHIKRWGKDKFSRLILPLVEEFKAKIILVGDKEDADTAEYIARHCGYPVLDLSAQTSLAQLGALLERAALLITNDSAILHLGSYLNTPVLAIFGPTSELKYSPWSDVCAIVKKDIFCRPCEKAQCRFKTLECMGAIKVEDVFKRAREILNNRRSRLQPYSDSPFKRILIVRTDRIGDVLLSTPVISSLRESHPYAYIAIMVAPYAKDIVEGNPDLDSVIIYDKDGKHKSWQRSFKFARNLGKREFDLAIILHPTNRAHLITFLAGIPYRLGYDRKLACLLTNRIAHTKQFGKKHELEYNLDLLKCIGIEPKEKKLRMPIKEESEIWVDALLRGEGVEEKDRLLAIHPGASCPSKIWPNERFAEVADRLAQKYGFKVLVVCGPKDVALADRVIKNMHQPAVNLAGKTSVSQLASALKRCEIFISNDSGPVHIASSLGVPVISIFGRNQPGLSPLRWGPTGKKDKVLHKQVGCVECLAHNCLKGFICLKAITVNDVINAADEILK